jgi:hypothetical protein
MDGRRVGISGNDSDETEASASSASGSPYRAPGKLRLSARETQDWRECPTFATSEGSGYLLKECLKFAPRTAGDRT